MDAPQYVYVDVPSGYFSNWMFYYTHHTDMADPQYVHVDEPSDYMFHGMFYYTQHREMYVAQYVSSVKKKNGSNNMILKRGKIRNGGYKSVTQYYVTRLVFLINSI